MNLAEAEARIRELEAAAREFSDEAVLSVCRPQRLSYWRSRFAALAASPVERGEGHPDEWVTLDEALDDIAAAGGAEGDTP